MKKFTKILCLLLAAVTILSFASCSKKPAPLLTYEGKTFSSERFNAFLAMQKYYQVQYYYTNAQKDISADSDFWNSKSSGDKTNGQLLKESVLEYNKILLLVDYYCDKYKLTITDDMKTQIDEFMEEAKTIHGGEDQLAITLAKYGITIEELRENYESSFKLDILQDYWYGENGAMKISEDKVKEIFFKDYFKFDFMYYPYFNESSDGVQTPYFEKDITDAEARTYFDNNYVKVQHILYMTVDKSQNPLSESEIAEAEKKAKAAFDDITSGKVKFEDKLSDNQDSGNEYVFTYGEMVKEFEEASFAMKADEVRLVKTKYGWHIIKKFATVDKDFTDIKKEVIYNVSKKRTETIANEMLEKVKKDAAEFKDGGTDAMYQFKSDNIMTENDLSNTKMYEAIKALKDSEIASYPSDNGIYLFKKKTLADSDIKDVYATIESTLINENYYTYLKSFFDSIEVNTAEYDKYDIVTITPFQYYS